jgi:hypothetical protein
MYPPSLLIHSATLHHNGNKQALSYTAPTGTATAGQTVTATTSHATAVIDTVASPMIVKTVSGTFAPGETISTATWSATLVSQDDYFDGNGLLVPDVTDTTVLCRYFPAGTAIKGGVMVTVSAHIVIPPDISVAMGDTLTITTAEFTKDFTISSDPRPVFEPTQDALSHWSCEIAKAGTAGGV